MADLRIDYAVLDATKSALVGLADQLRSAETRRDEMSGRWGGKQVERAMRGFVDDWDRHRRKLVEGLDDAAAQCDATVETFRGIEASLASVAGGGSSAVTAGGRG